MNTEAEEWRLIEGFGDRYEVSNRGNVRSVVSTCSNGRTIGGKPLAMSDNGHGYESVMFCVNYRKTRRYVHRLVLETFVGPCPDGMECRHIDGSRNNNCLENLEWCTHQDNVSDRYDHGTILNGERCNFSKISEDDAVEIRNLYATGEYTQKDLAHIYGLTQTGVGLVARGAVWAHAGGPITSGKERKARSNEKLLRSQA